MTGNAQNTKVELDQVGQINDLQIALQRAFLPVNRVMDSTIRQGWIECKTSKLTRLLGRELLPPLPAITQSSRLTIRTDNEPTLRITDLFPGNVEFSSFLDASEERITKYEQFRRATKNGGVVLGLKACRAFLVNPELLPQSCRTLATEASTKRIHFGATTIEDGQGHVLCACLELDHGSWLMQYMGADAAQPVNHSTILPVLLPY